MCFHLQFVSNINDLPVHDVLVISGGVRSKVAGLPLCRPLQLVFDLLELLSHALNVVRQLLVLVVTVLVQLGSEC